MIFEQVLKSIGTNIKVIREKQGISQQSLADACNFEKTNMSRIEAGKTNLTLRTLFKISQALKVTVSDLVDVEK